MKQTAVSIAFPHADKKTAATLEPVYLTGERYWHQTFCCAYSLQLHSGCSVIPHLYDDGTLTPKHTAPFLKNFREVRITTADEIAATLDRQLPAETFPALRYWRIKHPLLKKLTDIFIGQKKPRLLLDSDMLFYHKPDYLIDWCLDPHHACCMQDIVEAYGYPRSFLENLAGSSLPSKANIGILGLLPGQLNPAQMEEWLKKMIHEHGKSYNLVQGLCSMLFAQNGISIAPAKEYKLENTSAAGWQPDATMIHFVSDAKAVYFQHAWKLAMRVHW
ncbi:MAG: hypothetical protein AAF649_01170 [Verrucomicrobiota bacterium]